MVELTQRGSPGHFDLIAPFEAASASYRLPVSGVDDAEADARPEHRRKPAEELDGKYWRAEIAHVPRENVVEPLQMLGTGLKRHPFLCRPANLGSELGSKSVFPE